MKPAFRIAGALLALGIQGAAAQDRDNLLDAPERIEWDAGGLYEGRFSDGTPFLITLAYPEPDGLHDAGKGLMHSAYWYPRHFLGSMLALEAVPDQDGTLRLVHTPASGAQAQARFALSLGSDRRDARGRWTSGTGGKQLSFSLDRIVLYRAVALTLPSMDAQVEGSDRQFAFSALFPVLADEEKNKEISAWIRTQAGTCKAGIECSNKVEVSWHSKQLLSLRASTWTYGLGAAHGNYGATTRHYALAGGAPVLTRFTAFVAPSAECRDKVSHALVSKLRAQGLSWPDEGKLEYDREPDFLPTKASWNTTGSLTSCRRPKGSGSPGIPMKSAAMHRAHPACFSRVRSWGAA